MSNTVWIDTVSARPVAAVCVCAAPSEIANVFREPLDKVWAFLARHDGLRADGHNVFIYYKNDSRNHGGKIRIEVGVQVARIFTGEGDIICTASPSGRAAVTVHTGPYHRLSQAHAAVQRWCAANGQEPAGVDWEIYGDWNDDPSKLETRVCYLLR